MKWSSNICDLVYVQSVYQDRLPSWLSGKESTCQCRRCKRLKLDPRVRKSPWSRKWQSTAVFLPGKSHRQKSLMSDSGWGSQKIRHYWAHVCAHTHILHFLKYWSNLLKAYMHFTSSRFSFVFFLPIILFLIFIWLTPILYIIVSSLRTFSIYVERNIQLY